MARRRNVLYQDRLTRMVEIMARWRFSTSDQLAIALGVSSRTIWRDVSVLRSDGVPIEGEAGVGYRLRSNDNKGRN